MTRTLTRLTCSIPDCEQAVRHRGWCQMHYTRWRRTGDPLRTRQVGREERLAELNRMIAAVTDECVIWPHPVNSSGYPRVTVIEDGERRREYGHRLACTAANGAAPPDRPQAIHSCGNKRCVNPRHLRWGSALENAQDTISHGRSPRGERHWHHRLTEEQVRSIRSLCTLGINAKAIADMYGIAESTVWSIRLRATWSWLD